MTQIRKIANSKTQKLTAEWEQLMKRTTKQQPERKQVGVHIDVQLWRRFRAHALEQGIGAGQLIEELIRQYLDKKDKDKQIMR